MRVCVVGNSHIAAVKLAVDDGALKGTGTEFVFFGAPGQRFKKLRFANGFLSCPSDLAHIFLKVSGGRYKRIDPKEFDAVVVYGGSVFLHRLVGNLHRAMEVNGVYLSQQCFEVGVARWLETKLAFRLARRMSGVARRVILSPRPCPALRAAPNPETVDRNDVTPWIWSKLARGFRRRVWEQCREYVEGHGVEMFFQPESTLDEDEYTEPRFTTNSTRLLGLGREHGSNDVTHMNAAYGKIFVEHLLERLSRPVSASTEASATRRRRVK